MEEKLSKKFDEKIQYCDEDFKIFEEKVENVMKILNDMNNADKERQEDGIHKADAFLNGNMNLEDINEDNFIVKVKDNRTLINTKGVKDELEEKVPHTMDKFTFMQQMEEDAKKRSEIRQEREKIAQNFRKMGNNAFQNKEYEKAINMYSKAIEHVKDSPILYNNRALTFIKLRLYKRAIMDADYVLNKLDEKNLRSWLYRATSYYQLQDEKNFDTSVKWAKKNNSKETEYIENFIGRLKNGDTL